MPFQGFPLAHQINRGSWKLRPRPEVLATDYASGPYLARPRFDRMLHDVEFSMLMTDADFVTFKDWFLTTINSGADKFLMTIWDGEEYVQCLCQFTAPYNAQYYTVDRVIVGFSLVVHDLPVISDAAVYLLGLYGADFVDVFSTNLHFEVHVHYPSSFPISPAIP